MKKNKCSGCNGSGKCPDCEADRRLRDAAASGSRHCYHCGNAGYCQMCGGDGTDYGRLAVTLTFDVGYDGEAGERDLIVEASTVPGRDGGLEFKIHRVKRGEDRSIKTPRQFLDAMDGGPELHQYFTDAIADAIEERSKQWRCRDARRHNEPAGGGDGK
jgi:hypothetical protein